MMSRQRDFIKWIFGTSCTVTVVMTAAWAFETRFDPNGMDRGPASVPEKSEPSEQDKHKQKTLNLNSPSRLKVIGKPSSLVEINIEAPGQHAATAGSIVQLEARIEAQRDINDLRFAWLLPKAGLQVVSGASEGSLGTLGAGEQTTLRLNVLSETAENRQIHLHVYRVVNGEAMGKMAQYNTVNQMRIDREIQEKSDILGQMEKAGLGSTKVIH